MVNDLHRALNDISSMRRQMARTTEFRGYGPATLAGTGAFAVLAAAAQNRWVADPASHFETYLSIWVWTAVISAAVIGIQMQTRSRRIHSGLADEMIRMAVEQFLPSAVAGALITVVVARFVPQSIWMIPALWQIVFSLGVFSSCRFLPTPMLAAGIWYLITGLVCMRLGDTRALSAWAMGVPFGVGQFLVAVVLFLSNKKAVYEG